MDLRPAFCVVVVFLLVGGGVFGAPEDVPKGPCVPNPSQLFGRPISPLRCDLVLVDLPFLNRFDGAAIGILDGNNVSTGFRSLIPSRHFDAYIPSNLAVSARAEGGNVLQYTTGLTHWKRGRNRQANALAVGLPVPGKRVRLSTRVKVPERLVDGRERFCLFVAVSDQHHLTLCVHNMGDRGATDVILLQYESNDQVKRFTRKAIKLDGERVVHLQLEIFPEEDVVRAYYVLPGSSTTPIMVARVSVEPFFLNKDQAGTDADVGTRTHGGIMAVQRPQGTPVTYTVLSFDAEEIPSDPDPTDDIAVDFNVWKVENIYSPTSMAWAPDGKLFVAQATGKVTVLTFNDERTAVVDRREFEPIGNRLLLGIVVDLNYGEDGNDCVWLSHSFSSRNNGKANSGKITRACGPQLGNVRDVIVGLPRAIANHAVNNIQWGHDKELYITVGSNAAGGAVNTLQNSFLTRPEQPFSAAILRADVNAPGFRGDCRPAQDPQEMDVTGVASREIPDCDVELYATGTRNTFDCVWHRNGHLYCPDNGVGGAGSKPPLPSGWKEGDTCDEVVSGADAIEEHDVGVREDVLFDIQQGGYYGHPNPSRLECVLGAGNPNFPREGRIPRFPLQDGREYAMDFNNYVVGTPAMRNYRLPMASFGRNRSPDGIIAYESDAMCGHLRDELLVVFYSVAPSVHRIKLDASGTKAVKESTLRMSSKATGAAEDLKRPLGIAQDNRGTIFVSEFGGNRVSVMVPKPCSTTTV